MSAGLTPVLESGRCVCRFNSSPGGGACGGASAGLTPVLEGALCLQV